jgi:hypothetical protein
VSRHPRPTSAGRPNRRNQQSRRADRRARLAFLLLAGLLVGIGATGAYAAKQRERAPTVTYSAIGVGSGECDSRSDAEERLIIKHGTWLNLVNHTGASASVDTGRQRAIAIPDGSGVAVKLAVGVHMISLVPDCGPAVALAATIEVVNAQEMPDAVESPSDAIPGPPQAPGASPEEPAGQATDLSGTAGPAPRNDGGDAAPGESADATTGGRVSGPSGEETNSETNGGETNGGEANGGEANGGEANGEGPGGATGGTRGSPTAWAGGPLVDDIEGVVAIGVLGGEIEGLLLGRDANDQGGNLLAVIAAICVLGVTVAIIRAIVTQRASRTLRA